MSRARERWKPPLLGPLPPTFLRVEPDENQRKLLAASYMRQRSTDSADSNKYVNIPERSKYFCKIWIRSIAFTFN